MKKSLLLLLLVLSAHFASGGVGIFAFSAPIISIIRIDTIFHEIDSLLIEPLPGFSPRIAVSGGMIMTGKGHVPFWMRANQYGNTPLSGFSGFITGRIDQPYRHPRNIADWGFAAEGRINGGYRAQFILPELYIKARLSVFELRAGRSRQIMGLTDSTLSVGSFSVSGNALGVPKVELSIPEFYPLPVFGGIVAVKGNFSHGWLGSVWLNHIPKQTEPLTTPVKTYFHQKSLYGRIGKASGLLVFYGGFNHQVFWGNEEKIYGPKFTLNEWDAFFYAATGKTMRKSINGFEKGKIGNHLGSVDFGLELNLKRISVLAYRQNFYDVGALSRLANIKDGLNGLRIENRAYLGRPIYWKKILFEFLYTKSQAGELDAKPTKSGDENYYNGFYREGWSYKGIGLGTPFISTVNEVRAGFPNAPRDYFINNRVAVYNFGLEMIAYQFHFLTKLSYSQNFGTYGTSEIGHSRGNIRHKSFGIFPESDQFSGYLEVIRRVRKDFEIGCILAIDNGALLNNSTGFMVNAKKILK